MRRYFVSIEQDNGMTVGKILVQWVSIEVSIDVSIQVRMVSSPTAPDVGTCSKWYGRERYIQNYSTH
jgi:hypothetical protein